MTKPRSGWFHRLSGGLADMFRWLVPGLGIKRWYLFIFLGITLLAIGFGVVILEVYRTTPDDAWWLKLISTASLRFLARPLRALIFGGLGVGMILFGIWKLNRSMLSPFLTPGHSMLDTLRDHRQRGRGPRIVAIGGGHGQATLLRGLKQFSRNLTAVVSVADDGGSSGRLRRDLGIPPPGDIRNCLAALSNDEALLTQLFQYRFPAQYGSLEGHSFGNLFISSLTEITGSFEDAVVESGRVLAIAGRVLPSSLNDVRLVADVKVPVTAREVRVEGESRIPDSPGKVMHVWLEPSNPPAFPEVIQAILAADMIVIGPGSLYTSVLPNLLVPDIMDAVRASRGFKVFVCNVATQPGETDGYTVRDHLRALEAHVGGGFFEVVLANDRCDGRLPEGVEWVPVDPDLNSDYPLQTADLNDDMRPARHDARKLAAILMELLEERTGPLVE
ncbi:MAG TPA: gluconeogenesis factor YvcK family protein [Anaerolineales bacterium]|nr:gluconeogenesis factor YvcK family protein [Anaerolineales bacterium]